MFRIFASSLSINNCNNKNKPFNRTTKLKRSLKIYTYFLSFFFSFFQVEYRPCVIPSNCWDLMREFMQGFMGMANVSSQIPSYFTAQSQSPPVTHTKQNDVYQPMGTIQQYLEHFSNYRKQTNAPVATSRTWTISRLVSFRLHHNTATRTCKQYFNPDSQNCHP